MTVKYKTADDTEFKDYITSVKSPATKVSSTTPNFTWFAGD